MSKNVSGQVLQVDIPHAHFQTRAAPRAKMLNVSARTTRRAGRRHGRNIRYSVFDNFVPFDACDACNESSLPYARVGNLFLNNEYLASYSCTNGNCDSYGVVRTYHACCLNKCICDKSARLKKMFAQLQDRGAEGRLLPGSRQIYNDHLRCEMCHQKIWNLFFANVSEYASHVKSMTQKDSIGMEEEDAVETCTSHTECSEMDPDEFQNLLSLLMAPESAPEPQHLNYVDSPYDLPVIVTIPHPPPHWLTVPYTY